MSEIENILNYLLSKEVELNLATKEYSSNTIAVAKQKLYLNIAEKAKALIVKIGEKTQKEIKEYIEKTITYCLQSVFEDEYSFVIKFDFSKRDQMEIHFIINHYGLEVDPIELDPKEDNTAGGVLDVCSFALRIVCLSFEFPNIEKIVFLDEPFKNVSDKYKPAVGQMIREVSHLLKIQIIMSTHIQIFIENSDNIVYT